MDNAELVPRRADMRGSHESLAASSPSNSMNLGTGAGHQDRAGSFADPDDVEVNLEGQDSAWGEEENDILSYVQSKVGSRVDNGLHPRAACPVCLSPCVHITYGSGHLPNPAKQCILGACFWINPSGIWIPTHLCIHSFDVTWS